MDIKEIGNTLKELQVKADKYDEIKEELDTNISLINDKISEIQNILKEVSPILHLKKVNSKGISMGSKTIDRVQRCFDIIKENSGKISLPDLFDKMGEASLKGGAGQDVKIGLTKMPNIIRTLQGVRAFYEYNKSSNIQDQSASTILLKEKVKQKAEVGEIKDIEEDKDLLKGIPKKIKFMG